MAQGIGANDFCAMEAEGLVGKGGKIVVEIIKRGNIESAGGVDSEGKFGDIIILDGEMAFEGSGDFVSAVSSVGAHAISSGANMVTAGTGGSIG